MQNFLSQISGQICVHLKSKNCQTFTRNNVQLSDLLFVKKDLSKVRFKFLLRLLFWNNFYSHFVRSVDRSLEAKLNFEADSENNNPARAFLGSSKCMRPSFSGGGLKEVTAKGPSNYYLDLVLFVFVFRRCILSQLALWVLFLLI